MRYLVTILSSLLLFTSTLSFGALVSLGQLTTNDSATWILDSDLGREYLRLDTFDFTVAQTYQSISAGGIYEGYNIADATVSDDLLNAAMGGASSCGIGDSEGHYCGDIAGWTDGILGASLHDEFGDQWAYLSTDNSGTGLSGTFGLVGIGAFGESFVFDGWGEAAELDAFNLNNGEAINLLLYRDVKVPEPSIIALMSLGLLGLGFTRRKIKK